MRSGQRFGLLAQILLTLSIVGLLPLFVLVIGLVGMNRDAMTEQVLRTHTVATRGVSAQVAGFLDSRSAAVASVSRVLAVDPESDASRLALSALLESPLGIVGVVVLDGAGREVIRAQRKSLSRTIDRVLARRAHPGGLVVVDSPNGDLEAWLRIDCTLGSIGTLQTIVDLKPLVEQVNPRELGPLALLSLVDHEGNRILGARGVESFDSEMVSLATSGKAFGAGRYGERGDASIGSYSSVPGYSWVVLSRQPATVAEATARRLQRRTLLAVILAIGLLTVAVAVARQTLVRPIRDLIRDQRSILGPSEALRREGRGELAQLRDSFRILADRMRSREALGEVFLGRYQVLDLIGEGAMGSVFRGWDPTLERPVALKTVRFDRNDDACGHRLASQLVAEAANVAQFSHPNIVAVHDVQAASDVAFLALEFVDGISLSEYFDSQAPLSAAAVVQVGLGIARGLEAAHARGIVHHDIKPANVLLGYGGSLKIVDFGVSQTISNARTPSGFVVGTPGYLAPEVIQGHGYGPAADLFALGCILHQATTGSGPFCGRSIQEILVDTVRRDPPQPSTLIPGVPKALDVLIAELLRKNPVDRVESAPRVLDQLRSLEKTVGSTILLESRSETRSWESQQTVILRSRQSA